MRYYAIKVILVFVIVVGGSLLLILPFVPLAYGLRDDQALLGGAGAIGIGVLLAFAARGFNAWSAESGFDDWLDRYL